ncbi:hypothetical protein SAMN05660328_101292 [Streptococcus gallolyticus]|uniref:Uncharacterized protein n=2 Tax=Streptococcus gallolyticus TaxID=315405 RepID=A0A1I7FB80_9STRE|nr:hypothetical protein SAMN02983012_0440 [Streptococcus gallolyticus]SFU33375.1 hypothetical protein SAMN05660328_101292 [Streptococcus gallolyticus]
MMTKNFMIRNVSDDMFEQLHTISKKYHYASFNEFMLSQVENIVMNDGLNLYENQFAETLSTIKEQQAQILEMLLKNEISLTASSAKQDIVEELTLHWLRFMDDVDALEAERRAGG